MTSINLAIPQVGQPNTTEQPKEANNFTLLNSLLNGNLDSTNITAGLAQSATVNQGSQTVKGNTNIATSEVRSNTAYATLTTPDQVTGLVLPFNGLIAVWYQAIWQESVSGAARAAIFLGSNQVSIAASNNTTPVTTAAAMITGSAANTNRPLFSTSAGLASADTGASAYTGDISTGQIIGASNTSSTKYSYELNGSTSNTANSGLVGGPCYMFAAAGTYAVSVQFKATSGSVTVSSRRMMVQALSFA